MKVTVLGGGSWATALVKIFSEGNHTIKWWLRNKENVDFIQKFKHNPKYLSDVRLNMKKIEATIDPDLAFNNSDLVVVAIPSAFIKTTLSNTNHEHWAYKPILSATKGLIPEDRSLISSYLEDQFGVLPKNMGVIAGPCHAEEVALKKESYLTIAGNSEEVARIGATALRCRYIYTSITDDLIGVEYAAILKNIYALAAGIANGLNYGDNFQAVIVSNAMQEMNRFISHVHPRPRNVLASAYAGDLLVTAYSRFSRNRTFGSMIGKGYSVRSIMIDMNMVAEGYYATKTIYEMNQELGLRLPLVDMVYNVLYKTKSPLAELKKLEAYLR